MVTSAQQLLDSFEHLPEMEKRIAASEIIRRTVEYNLLSISDEELVLSAEELFLELDRREAQYEKS